MAAQTFRFTNLSATPGTPNLTFSYAIAFDDGQTLNLTEQLTLPLNLPSTIDPTTQRILEALHIGLGLSYYKLFLPPALDVPYQLSSSAADFWNTVYRDGLGEFLYINKLSVDQVAQFTGNGSGAALSPQNYDQQAILGIGGGKDSIVAGEILKSLGVPLQGFVLATGEHLGQAQAVAQTMGLETLAIKRVLDPQLLELNKRPDAYNGHIPISMVFALCGTLLAHLTNSAYVVVANEASASLPQTEWQGRAVNHQWSKSLEFEKLFQEFVQGELAAGISYFSAIRPLSSVAVAKLFAHFPVYFEVFTSDNSVFRIDPSKRPNARWSLESPKSLSSFILLAPWLDQAQLTAIFGMNFLDQASLLPLFKELTGQEGHPPLDCVGTVEELVASLSAALAQGKLTDAQLVQNFQPLPNGQAQLEALVQKQGEHAFPADLAEKLAAQLQAGLA